jgi:hypothetical protein
MSKTISIDPNSNNSEDQLITITETVTEDRVTRISIAQLRSEYNNYVASMASMKTEANRVAQQITDIAAELNLTIQNPPAKLP